jgi:hypothetical protein
VKKIFPAAGCLTAGNYTNEIFPSRKPKKRIFSKPEFWPRPEHLHPCILLPLAVEKSINSKLAQTLDLLLLLGLELATFGTPTYRSRPLIPPQHTGVANDKTDGEHIHTHHYYRCSSFAVEEDQDSKKSDRGMKAMGMKVAVNTH